jgi:uncharacterized membrane protein
VELITKAIDKVEDFLGHSPHPAIVAVPLGAFAVSNVCDGLALATGDERYDDVASTSMAIGLVGAVAAAATGLRDYGFIPADRQPNHDVATAHGLGNATVGALFAASYILRIRARNDGRRPGMASRLLGFAGGALATYTGWLGGKLVEEYGESVQPVMEGWSEESGSRSVHGDGDSAADRGREPIAGRPGTIRGE